MTLHAKEIPRQPKKEIEARFDFFFLRFKRLYHFCKAY